MQQLHGRDTCPVFAFGDMNATVTESVFDVYEQNGVKKLFDMTEQRDSVCSIHGDPMKDGKGVFHGRKARISFLSCHFNLYCFFIDR